MIRWKEREVAREGRVCSTQVDSTQTGARASIEQGREVWNMERGGTAHRMRDMEGRDGIEQGGGGTEAHHMGEVIWLRYLSRSSQSGTPNCPACGPTHEMRVCTLGQPYICTGEQGGLFLPFSREGRSRARREAEEERGGRRQEAARGDGRKEVP